ncbi:uncharacterized protein MYCFIDRAFT_172690 [Pseudocercospora fijiensis CIRAD86]|uniref:Uncharacterized protein n=1 Tax=Pseudocercospora fijiensis (strain CIRAD86) TaxID=383855 RepID=M3BCL2_PSEFD|nr:uncharacterized protein MYCFIDRAFT_172690 [Pseudocercospora fijiensis CIRAD86]EME87017.1 hypothetical protein MYCFIDRAFT_172690 [Pseudocercospora fijiensis CIRAD86]
MGSGGLFMRMRLMQIVRFGNMSFKELEEDGLCKALRANADAVVGEGGGSKFKFDERHTKDMELDQ